MEHTDDLIGKQDLADRVLIAVAHTSVEIQNDFLQETEVELLIDKQDLRPG